MHAVSCFAAASGSCYSPDETPCFSCHGSRCDSDSDCFTHAIDANASSTGCRCREECQGEVCRTTRCNYADTGSKRRDGWCDSNKYGSETAPYFLQCAQDDEREAGEPSVDALCLPVCCGNTDGTACNQPCSAMTTQTLCEDFPDKTYQSVCKWNADTGTCEAVGTTYFFIVLAVLFVIALVVGGICMLCKKKRPARSGSATSKAAATTSIPGQPIPGAIAVQPVVTATTTMQVTCPQDVTAGQSIQITTPAGQSWQVVVPTGVVPGSVFAVQVPV